VKLLNNGLARFVAIKKSNRQFFIAACQDTNDDLYTLCASGRREDQFTTGLYLPLAYQQRFDGAKLYLIRKPLDHYGGAAKQ
jgi:thiamine pyrophosphokinase